MEWTRDCTRLTLCLFTLVTGVVQAVSTPSAAVAPEVVILDSQKPTVTVSEGNSTVVTCMATGVTTPIIYWFLDGVLLVIEDCTETADAATYSVTSNLMLTSVMRESNFATITCTASNGVGANSSDSTQVIVLFAPNVTSISADQEVTSLDPVSFSCTVDSYPPSNISWFRRVFKFINKVSWIIIKGTTKVIKKVVKVIKKVKVTIEVITKVITKHGKVILMKVRKVIKYIERVIMILESILTLLNTTAEDSGIYTCSAVNSEGSANMTTELQVLGVSCGQLAAPSNGSVDTSAGTSFGDVARYTCNKGYTLNGPSKRTCQADRQWSRSMPTCEIVDCGSPTLPNGTFTLVNSITTYNSKAMYECRIGFKLIGSAGGICQANGKWEGSEGRFCREKKDCALPLDIMIMLDHSASVKQNSFERQIDFTRGFVSLLPVAKDNVRVGLIRYWYIVELVFDFDDFFTDTVLESVISAMRRPEWHQRTSTGAALQQMVDTFTGDSGARDPTVSRVAIVVTDGKATDEIDAALQEARNNNVTIYAYGIGNAFRAGSDELKELQELASDNNKVDVIKDSTEDLSNLVNSLIDQFVNCDDSSASTPPPAPPACQPMEYYNQTTRMCEKCNCNGFERTTAPLQCDPITGSCICRDWDRRGGPHCDHCIWELRGYNCDMCREGMRKRQRQGPEYCRAK